MPLPDFTPRSRSRDWLTTAFSGLMGFRNLAAAGALRKAHFLDGKTRRVPRQLARLLWAIAEQPELHVECQQARALYRGGDVIDVGAHEGLYSAALIPSAIPGTRMVSLEPDSGAYRILLGNLAALAATFPGISLPALPFPIGDGRQALASSPNPWHRAYHSSDALVVGDKLRQTLTVDSLVEALDLKPDLIKVDVEGAEQAVIIGSQQTLRRFDCRILLEVHPLWQPEGIKPDACDMILKGLGYHGEKFEDNELVQRWVYRKSV